MCPQGPEGGLASRRASQATLKEALGALGTGGRRALCCYGGMSTRRTGWSEACEVHSGGRGESTGGRSARTLPSRHLHQLIHVSETVVKNKPVCQRRNWRLEGLK